MYSFEKGMFLTDGTDPTAFAARHLASDGFVVLQIAKKHTTVSLADTETSLEGYRSAVDSLDRAGLIDRSKVGVAGFSWSCWYAEDAIVRDPSLFAAATIADGLTNSYAEYQFVATENFAISLQERKIRGGAPYGDGLPSWLATAAGFHMDQVKTPVRFEAMTPINLLGEWELYSALHNQAKPVDLIYFPEGLHIHQKPLERLESQQGSIDWFRFWLQDYVDPDPSKAGQYRRWRTLKEASDHPSSTDRKQ
jgi:dipeptidyl aminopeptidase/acylaminoacyl peptidase